MRLLPSDSPLLAPADLRPGDLLFCVKRSFMASLLHSVGDPWRHVAMVVDLDDGSGVAEVTGGPWFGCRPLSEALDAYDTVAVGRPAVDPGCRDRAIAWVLHHVGRSQLYAWDDVLLTGLVLLSRRVLSVGRLDRLAAALADVAARAPRADGPSMTCSAFIFEAFAAAGDRCRLPVPMSALDALPSAVSPAEAGPSPVELTSMPDADLDAMLRSLTLYELLPAPAGGLEEVWADDEQATVGVSGHSRSSASLTQLLRTGAVVADLLGEYARRYPLLDSPAPVPGGGPEVDGRWVSPGDLWRSPGMVKLGHLKHEPETPPTEAARMEEAQS